jgi:hypothetical protein
MIDAGLPIVQCLDIQTQQSESKVLRNTLRAIKQDVEVVLLWLRRSENTLKSSMICMLIWLSR